MANVHCIVLAACVVAAPAYSQARKATVVGYIENAVILPAGLRMKAKMDTGARTTSIDATDIERFRRDGKEWVRFAVRVKGRKVAFTRRVLRISRIRRTRTEVVQRVVVALGICVAGYYKHTEVNLGSRSNMLYPLLIGRRFMSTGRLLIDSSAKFRGKAICPNAPSKEN